ncbi:hypothetical protein M409DRAFT_28214 [Zasmidium cellare ATCC 36951]|uniref:Uncharacterized protein n=1 Tax=Zasmidium cellare ATCC 36951 TaxID=1080233 RepID=A0A6A6C395_ZASCE|nr:uncharacterized protein M409DRAFT_28214 [Zasmidium cellare ATCC 36951]KAF2161485.1 hypothetical protein M409DRAFT_28214 [Zasmidium cellare ATCC 36951]
MQFKYIAAFIASLAVNGALAIPVSDAEAMNAALEDAALQARAEQIEQADQFWDDDFLDWDKAKVMRRAEQIEQAGQFWDDDFDKAKVMKRAEQAQQAQQARQGKKPMVRLAECRLPSRVQLQQPVLVPAAEPMALAEPTLGQARLVGMVNAEFTASKLNTIVTSMN